MNFYTIEVTDPSGKSLWKHKINKELVRLNSRDDDSIIAFCLAETPKPIPVKKLKGEARKWHKQYESLKGLLQNCAAQGGIKKRLLLDNLGKQGQIKAKVRAAIAQALGVELMKAGAIRFMEDQVEVNLDYVITADVIVVRNREKLKEICDG